MTKQHNDRLDIARDESNERLAMCLEGVADELAKLGLASQKDYGYHIATCEEAARRLRQIIGIVVL